MEDLDLLKSVPASYRLSVEQYMLRHWSELAAECYGNYRQKGLGLMVLLMAEGCVERTYLDWDCLQANWDALLGDADEPIQSAIKRLVPTYCPEDECVFCLEFAAAEVPSVVWRVTRSVLSIVSQVPGVAVPRLRRFELMTPKDAYEMTAIADQAHESQY